MAKIVYAAKFEDGRIERYKTWPDCQKATSGVSGVLFQGFDSYSDLIKWEELASLLKTGTETEEKIKVFTDGSFTQSVGYPVAGWGYVVVRDNKILKEDYGVTPFIPTSRNIDGECFAALKAMEWSVANREKVAIIYDYISIGPWALGIQKANTETSKWFQERAVRLTESMLFSFYKVKGHTGVEWNEYVDKLAARAISEEKESGIREAGL